MFAIGNEELEVCENIGDKIKCPICGNNHVIEYGKIKKPDGTWEPSRMLAFYTCGDEAYLVGINGKRV